jgi:hypothetical protein
MSGISSSKVISPTAYARKDYAYITMSANQTTGIADTNPVKFNTMSGNIAFDPATYRVTLKANKTYIMTASVLSGFSGNTGVARYQFYNVTTSAFIGTRVYNLTVTGAGHESSSTEAFVQITPTVDTIVDFRIVAATALTQVSALYTHWEIQEIETFSPMVQTYQYAYVSPDTDFSAAVTYVSGGGSISAVNTAKCVFYKTSNNIWYMKGILKMTVSSASRTAFIVNVAGVLPDGDGSTYWQSGSADTNGAIAVLYNQMYVSGGNSRFNIAHATATTTHYASSFDIRLASKPTGMGLPADV